MMKMSIAGTKEAVQMVETFLEEAPAEAFLNVISQHEGVTHVRLLKPSRKHDGYRVQALMVGESVPEEYGPLPDGMRRVLVTDSFLSSFEQVSRDPVYEDVQVSDLRQGDWVSLVEENEAADRVVGIVQRIADDVRVFFRDGSVRYFPADEIVSRRAES